MQPPTQPSPQQSHPHQPQWKPVTEAPTLREIFVPWGRGLRNVARDIWQVGIVQGGLEAWRDLRALLASPPRRFLIAVGVVAFLAVVFCTLSLTGAVASQANYLRHLMDQLP